MIPSPAFGLKGQFSFIFNHTENPLTAEKQVMG